MRLLVERERSSRGATVGKMLVDGEIGILAWTLEDEVRERPDRPVAEWKVPGKTAIPAGTYRVVVTMSARFGRRMPLLLDVPGFEGIRIHSGNTEADTEGCLLVGLGREGQALLYSRAAFAKVYARIEEELLAGHEVTISLA